MLSKNLIVSIFANVFQGLALQTTFGIITVEWIPFFDKKTEGKGGKNKNNFYIMVNKARALRRLCKGQQKPDQGHCCDLE